MYSVAVAVLVLGGVVAFTQVRSVCNTIVKASPGYRGSPCLERTDPTPTRVVIMGTAVVLAGGLTLAGRHVARQS